MSEIDVKCCHYIISDKHIIIDGEHDMDYCEDNNCKHYGNKEQCEKTHCYYRMYSKLYTKFKLKVQECEELKQENEELKKQVRFKNQFRDYAHKYKQCLNEIEEIIKGFSCCEWFGNCECCELSDDENPCLNEILQLIKQVKEGD